jgi:predicted nucleic acid-binding protein
MALLIDTDILIDYLRDREEAANALEPRIGEAYLSVMTVAELYQGVREGRERIRLAQTLSAFTILTITTEIAEKAGLWSREFRKSHGSGLADCLIAATADAHGLRLMTLNGKHYPMLDAVYIPYRKPGN